MQEQSRLIGKSQPLLRVAVRLWCRAVNHGHPWSEQHYRYDDGHGLQWLVSRCTKCGTEVFLPVKPDSEDRREPLVQTPPLVQIQRA